MTTDTPGSRPATETLTTGSGLSVTIVDIGAAIGSLLVPASSAAVDAVLSYPETSAYRSDPYYLGTTVGPFANRIAGATYWHRTICQFAQVSG